MDQKSLFPAGSQPEAEATKALPPRLGPKRLRSAVRNQIEFQQCALDDLLAEDHQARIVWSYVDSLDLAELFERIQAVAAGPGQAPPDPRILLSLWLYATLRGGGQCTGTEPLVSVSRGLSLDLRRGVDELSYALRLSHGARRTAGPPADGERGQPMAEGLVTLDRVAQDGMKVRASAGAASFRRQPTLEEALTEAEEQLRQLKEELDTDPAAGKTRQQAARVRAAEERAA